jgi:hypothetical protein
MFPWEGSPSFAVYHPNRPVSPFARRAPQGTVAVKVYGTEYRGEAYGPRRGIFVSGSVKLAAHEFTVEPFCRLDHARVARISRQHEPSPPAAQPATPDILIPRFGKEDRTFVRGLNGTYRYMGEFDPTMMNAHGYGVWQLANGTTYSGLWADGVHHGHVLIRLSDGSICYYLYDHGGVVHLAAESKSTGSRSTFDYQPCPTTDARFQTLKTAALAVEVRLPRCTPRWLRASVRTQSPLLRAAGEDPGRRARD